MKAEMPGLHPLFCQEMICGKYVALNDELAHKLEGRASELGLMLGEFLAKAIEQNADKLFSAASILW